MKKSMVLAFALALALGVMIGCGGDGGGGDGGVIVYSATGTYGDDIVAGLPAARTIHIEHSTFPADCGPQEGAADDVVSVTFLDEDEITIDDIDGDAGVDTEIFDGERTPDGAVDSLVGIWVGDIGGDRWVIELHEDGDIIIRTGWGTCH